MTQDHAKLRTGARNYHDRVFEEEVFGLINTTRNYYQALVLLPASHDI